MPSGTGIVAIEPGKKVDLRYDRKGAGGSRARAGRRKVPLRFLVHASNTAPEGYPVPPIRNHGCTGFDAIAVGPDGRFSTPPLPPNLRAALRDACCHAEGGREPERLRRRVESTTSPKWATFLSPIAAKRATSTAPIDAKKPCLEIRAFDEAGADSATSRPGSTNRSPQAIRVDGLAVMGSGDLSSWGAGRADRHAPGSPRDLRGSGSSTSSSSEGGRRCSSAS